MFLCGPARIRRAKDGSDLDSGFPWDVAITAASTLLAAVLGSVLAIYLSRRHLAAQVSEQQRTDALVDLLLETMASIEQLRQRWDGRTDEPVNWTAWRRAMLYGAVVLPAELHSHFVEVDREMFILNEGIKRLRGAGQREGWTEMSRSWEEALDVAVAAARAEVGKADRLERLTGRPDWSDQIWTEEYWGRVRARIEGGNDDEARESAVRSRGASGYS